MARTPSSEPAASGTKTIEVAVRVTPAAIQCGRNGGNLRARAGDSVAFAGERPFRLEFFRLGTEGEADDVSGMRRWPFSSPPEPPDGIVHVKDRFVGTLAAGAGAFKYYVTVGNLRLDPIIIVD